MKIRRHKKAKKTVPIIPLIDILAILLIFMVVSTQFKEDRRILVVDLPEVTEVEVDTVQQISMIIELSVEGQLSVNGEIMTHDALVDKLKQSKISQEEKFELELDKQAPIQEMLKLWDTLVKGGYAVDEIPLRMK